MKDYQERKQERIDRYRQYAENAEKRSTNAYEASGKAVDGIPMGQPILVGHHSEKRHRAALKRSHNAMDKFVAESNKSDYWERRADAVESDHAISGHDPEAIAKLNTKLERLESHHSLMKTVNARLRKLKLKDLTPESAQTVREFISSLVTDTEQADKITLDLLQTSKCWDGVYSLGYPPYALQNSNGNIRRVRERIKALERETARPQAVDTKVNGVTVTDNKDMDSVELHFPGKPSDAIRSELKANGWRWARLSKCWYRSVARGGFTYETVRVFAEHIAAKAGA